MGEFTKDNISDDLAREEYRKKREAIWGEIIQLNTNNYLMNQIVSFPFHLFPHKDNHFWDSIFFSMYQTSVMIIYKLCFDRDSETLTLLSLREFVIKKINFNKKNKLTDELKLLGFDRKILDYKQLIENERHNRIAHFNSTINSQPSEIDITRRNNIINGLENITILINQFFSILCFDGQKAYTYLEYNESLIGQINDPRDRRSDIEQLLDFVARKSLLLNMPEDQRVQWSFYKHNLSNEEIEILNKYRKKFSLPEV